MRYLGNRTFYQRGGQWHESGFQPEKDQAAQVVTIGSNEYLDLLKQDAGNAKFLALGQVVFRQNGQWVEVRGTGK